MNIEPLPNVSEKFNQIRVIAIILKDALKSLTDEEKKQLYQIGEFNKKRQFYMVGNLWLLVRGILLLSGADAPPLRNNQFKKRKAPEKI